MQVRYSLILVVCWMLSALCVSADSAVVVNALHVVSTTGGSTHASSTAHATLDSTTTLNGRVVESVHRETIVTTPYAPRAGTTTHTEHNETPRTATRDDTEPTRRDVPYAPNNDGTITSNHAEPSIPTVENTEPMDLVHTIRTIGALVRTLVSYAVSNFFF